MKNACVAAFVRATNSGVTTQRVVGEMLRTRMYSRLVKKWTLSFTIGPPSEKPIWLRSNVPFSLPRALLSNVLVESLSLRKNS